MTDVVSRRFSCGTLANGKDRRQIVHLLLIGINREHLHTCIYQLGGNRLAVTAKTKYCVCFLFSHIYSFLLSNTDVLFGLGDHVLALVLTAEGNR